MQYYAPECSFSIFDWEADFIRILVCLLMKKLLI